MPAIKQQERTLPSHSTGAKKEGEKKKKLRPKLRKSIENRQANSMIKWLVFLENKYIDKNIIFFICFYLYYLIRNQWC